MKCAFYEHIPHYTTGLGKELAKKVELDVFYNAKSRAYRIPGSSAKRASLSLPNYRSPKSLVDFLRQIGNLLHYDIVHVNSSKQGVSALAASKLSGVPYIYTNHGLPRLDTPETSKVDEKEHLLLHRVARGSKGFVTISNYIRKMLSKRYRVNPYVIYHGVDFSRFNPHIKGERVRSKHTLKEGIILSVMRLHHHKDPFTLLRAASHVAKESNVKFVIIGSGPLGNQVRRFVEKNDLNRHVLLIPHVDWLEINEYYAACDIFVLPSLVEGFGIAGVEAMACGKPTLVANSGALPEIVGKAGCLFEPRDSKDLAEKMSHLLSSKGERQELGLKGYNRVKERFTWEIAAKRYLELYKKAQ
jgi:glycosyltransferase involved in cell wall biosynthesis